MRNDLKWYVLNYDFNKKKVIYFNIFTNSRFLDCLEENLEEFKNNNDYEKFKENLRTDLMYCFWSKREYEISVSDAFETNLDMYEKIDVYSQVLPNLDNLAMYLVQKIFVEIN